MSTATPVPETLGLDGERAIATIRAARVRMLAKDSFSRLRWADGFSHSRAMAFQVVLTMIPGAIVLVAIAAELHWDTLSRPIVQHKARAGLTKSLLQTKQRVEAGR